MEKIASFTIDHIKLQPGVYVSRKDRIGAETVTTFDLRMTSPNEEPVMNTAEMHAIEHLGATYLRNDPEFGEKIVYFGPMGCRTGFYLLIAGDYTSEEILPLVTRTYEFIRDYQGEIPGASAKDCGNYLDMNLNMAHYLAGRYLDQVLLHITPDRLAPVRTAVSFADQSAYPLGFLLCQFQESAHISSMPYWASQPSSSFALSHLA